MREVLGSSFDRRLECSVVVSFSTLPPVLLVSAVAHLLAVQRTNRKVVHISPSITGHGSRLASNDAFPANMTC